MEFKKDFDGSGRPPRLVQEQALKFLKDNWDDNTTDVFVLRLPTGAGKSYIARTVMRAVNSVGVLTPNNALLAQYLKDYPKVNAFVGRKHYLTSMQHEEAKIRALGGENTFFNMSSYLSLKDDVNFIKPSVVILDEADQIINYLESASGFTIPAKFGGNTLHQIRVNLEAEVQRLKKCLLKNPTSKVAPAHKTRIAKYEDNIKKFKLYGTDYTLVIESSDLVEGSISYRVKPVVLPTKFTKDLFAHQKVILLSGSIFAHDVEAMFGEDVKVKYFDCESPIAPERRQVYLKPVSEGCMMYPIDYKEVATTLRSIIFDTFSYLRPAIVHCTYSDIRALQLMFKSEEAIFTFNPASKDKALSDWQANPNKILFAAGCHTGLDLKDDMCRLNIILKAQYPSQLDVGVRKRLHRLDGSYWADLNVLRHFIQACGRSTRNESDFSVTVVLDDRVAREVNKHYKDVPLYFKQSLNFNYLDGQKQEIENLYSSLTR